MERRGRRLLATFITAAMCTVLPGSGSTSVAAPGGKAPLLAGHSVIRGDRMATMDVRLDKRLAIPLTDKGLDAMIDVRAAGRASGFVLEGHDLGHPDGWPLFGYWQLAFCKTSHCKPDRRKHSPFGTLLGQGALDDPENPTVLYLPAGIYTLHVVADRGPVRVDLDLPGLNGHRTFRPRNAEPGGATTPQAGEINDSGGGFVYSHGYRTNFTKTAAFATTALRIRNDATVSNEVGHCHYENTPPAAPIGFAPGCPAGSNFLVHFGVISPLPIEVTYIGHYFFPSEQLQGVGTWYAAASLVKDAQGITFGLDLGPGNGIGREAIGNELDVMRNVEDVF